MTFSTWKCFRIKIPAAPRFSGGGESRINGGWDRRKGGCTCKRKILIVLSERKKRKFLDIRFKNRGKVGSIGVRNGGV